MHNIDAIQGSSAVWKKPLVVADSEEASGNPGGGHFGQGPIPFSRGLA